MARPKKVDYYVVKGGGATYFHGEPVTLVAGAIYNADDPIVKGRDELFEPFDPERHVATSPGYGRRRSRPEVEQATDNPGETRD